MSQQKLPAYFSTSRGRILHADSKEVCLDLMKEKSVDLIMTSPPFGLVRKKTYGNADSNLYLDWFRPFAAAFKRVLKDNRSLVIDIGGAWISGQPTRSLYHFKLLIMLCEEFGFHLAQESTGGSVKAPNARRVGYGQTHPRPGCHQLCLVAFAFAVAEGGQPPCFQPYSASMKSLLKNGYRESCVLRS